MCRRPTASCQACVAATWPQQAKLPHHAYQPHSKCLDSVLTSADFTSAATAEFAFATSAAGAFAVADAFDAETPAVVALLAPEPGPAAAAPAALVTVSPCPCPALAAAPTRGPLPDKPLPYGCTPANGGSMPGAPVPPGPAETPVGEPAVRPCTEL